METVPAECAGPVEAQCLGLRRCNLLVVLTRHSQRGGRSEDACGEVTGHPIDKQQTLILDGLFGCMVVPFGVFRCFLEVMVETLWVSSGRRLGRWKAVTWPWWSLIDKGCGCFPYMWVFPRPQSFFFARACSA